MVDSIIGAVFLLAVGVLFFLNSKNIGEGAFKFYKWFYTEERLVIMFKITGILLIVVGLILIFLK